MIRTLDQRLGGLLYPLGKGDENDCRIAWATDIHLNFLELSEVKEFCREIRDHNPDLLLIAGDIGEAPSITGYLEILENELQCPIYFVLGNHDFYFGSITDVHLKVRNLTQHSHRLNWLTDIGIVKLTDQTCLVGHDSWADDRFGDYRRSEVMLNDYLLIKELSGHDKKMRLKELKKLGDNTAERLKAILPNALKRFRHILLLTHVPPFKEACWHDGKVPDDNWLPHFSCKAVGKVLIKLMKVNPNREMTVLCGHTHGSGEVRIRQNLHVITGGADYGCPILQNIFTVQ